MDTQLCHFSPVWTRLHTGVTRHWYCWQLIAGYSSGAHRLPTRFHSSSHDAPCVAVVAICSSECHRFSGISPSNLRRRANALRWRPRLIQRGSGWNQAPRPGSWPLGSTDVVPLKTAMRTISARALRLPHPTQVRTGGTRVSLTAVGSLSCGTMSKLSRVLPASRLRLVSNWSRHCTRPRATAHSDARFRRAPVTVRRRCARHPTSTSVRLPGRHRLLCRSEYQCDTPLTVRQDGHFVLLYQSPRTVGSLARLR